jgi:glutamyl-tRNA synthetase
MKTLADAIPLVDFFFQEVQYDAALLIQKGMDKASTLEAIKAAEEALAGAGSFEEGPLEETLRPLADKLGLKAGQVFGCIRVACTGRTISPPLFGTLSILGREAVLRRLRQAIGLLAGAQQREG